MGYDVYHAYPLKHIVNSNLDIFMIRHMATRKVNNPMTKKKEFQFQLAYICYSHFCIDEPMGDIVMDLHKDHFSPKTVSKIAKCLKFPMSRTLSVIMIYEDGGSMVYRFLAPLTFAPCFNYMALDYLSVLY